MSDAVDLSQEMARAVRRQTDRAMASKRVDRTGWTDEQWCDDAERLMSEEDGAVTSLVNGHALRLIRERKRLRTALETIAGLEPWRRAESAIQTAREALAPVAPPVAEDRPQDGEADDDEEHGGQQHR